ncbi:hypothetical protein Btru_034284 [Bulinus truncatus]|nr:hypothetical protein Btru_034284 [Bulinus truncatus]
MTLFSRSISQKELEDILEICRRPHFCLIYRRSRLAVDNLISEVKQLEKNVKQLQDQVAKSDEDIKEYFAAFIEEANYKVNLVQKKLSEIHDLTIKLAHNFCEPENGFKLEECLNSFNMFCQKVKQCQKDNEQRKIQDERAEKRRQENEVMKANKGNKEPKSPQDEDGSIIDNLLKDIRKGFKLRKTTSIKRNESQKLNSKSMKEPVSKLTEPNKANGDADN